MLTSSPQILFCVENEANSSYPYKGFNSRRNEVRHLAALRLVNRGFCASASPQLFRHIVAICVPLQKESPLTRLVGVSNSPYAKYVERIEVGFRLFENSGVEPLSLYLDDLAGVLPGCLDRLPNINAVELHDTPSSLPWNKKRAAVNTFATALHNGSLLNLTDLEVTLPNALEFGQILFGREESTFQILQHTLQSLRHLGLHVATDDDLYSRPDLTNTAHLFRLVELAVNVSSLTISSSIPLGYINFRSLRLLHLKYLDLKGGEASAEALYSLVEQSKESIRSVRFHKFKLNSGRWEIVLMRMSRLPRILDIDIGSCGYSNALEIHRVDTLSPCPPAWPEAILSQAVNDGMALRFLLLQVNENRLAAGLSVMPESPYKCSYWGSPYVLRDIPS